MAEQETARTIIFDLVQLEKLGAELERRYRINPTTRVIDVLSEIDSDDHMLYAPQLAKLYEDLVRRGDAGTLAPLDPAIDQTVDVGDDLHRSLMATAMADGSNPIGSTPSSSKVSSGSSGGIANSKSEVPERIDQFRILRELGTGAFGVVYLAEDEQLQRKVAIKVPKVSDPKRSASYINEARKAAAIDSKGIVPIYHVGCKENGVPFVVQKLIDGPSLRFLLSRYGSLPPAHAVTLMRDIAVALGAAHRLGIYHRDLKPDNVLIDGSGVPWIADFGLAISESEQAQRKGEIAGTLMYMSPEQIQGRADWLDGRSDIWALGIMLYELLLGKPPFSGKNRQSLMEQICHREPRPLQQSSAALTPLNEVFQKCCAKSPSDRYSSVEELSEDLTLLINEGLPTQPIDGSDLHFEQPISQYPSGNSQGSRLRTGGSSVTQLSSHGGTTRDSDGSGLHVSGRQATNGQGAPDNLSAAGPLPTLGSPQTYVSPKAIQLGCAMTIGVSVASVLLIGLPQWYSGSAGSSSELASNSSGGNNATAAAVPAVVDGTSADKSMLTPQVDAETKPLNALGIDLANGSSTLPWIVAADGSGSHRTISAAIAASEAGAFVSLKPGVYKESLKLVQPITLIGSGEPNECEISNADETPIQVACSLGSVRIANVSVAGNAVQTGKEFNTIEVTSGKLRVENCHLRATTWNAIKVLAGGSLEVAASKFYESNAFAVSGLNHVSISVNECEFFQSGVQSVGGLTSVTQSTFRGAEGVYVEQSGDTSSTILDCKFIGCLSYGVIATDKGIAAVENSQFEHCKFGVQVSDGECVMNHCTFSKCSSAAVALSGGTAQIATGSVIQDCGNFGCQIVGGSLELLDSQFSRTVGSGIIAEGNVTLRLRNSILSECGGYGINMSEGRLDIEGGSIDRCDQGGICLIDKFSRGTVVGTKFTDNLGGGIVFESGDLDCQDVQISGSEIGLFASGNASLPVNITFTKVQFANINEVAADLEGNVKLTVRQGDFSDLPESKHYRRLNGAQVSVEL